LENLEIKDYERTDEVDRSRKIKVKKNWQKAVAKSPNSQIKFAKMNFGTSQSIVSFVEILLTWA
jgi:hypothetical protein